MAKKLIPGIGCKNGRALIWGEGREHAMDDVLALCRHYGDNGADELLICDLSETDEDHERTIRLIKEAAKIADVPVIAGGRVSRLEDIKKYLYAGAKAVFLNGEDEENVDLIKEGASRFGSEKIYVWLPGARCLGRMEEFAQLGASMAIVCWDEPRGGCRQTDAPSHVSACDEARRMLSDCPHMPVLAFCGEDRSEEAAAFLKIPAVEGVILGKVRKGGCMELKHELKGLGIAMNTFESEIAWERFRPDAQGLIPVVVQDYKTSQVLMAAHMNREAFETTLRLGKMTYYSRSRQSLWLKGEDSGHFQYVKSLHLNCDHDAILARVRQVGSACCCTGARSCFIKTLARREYRDANPLKVFEDVFDLILDRKENPREGSYTTYLFDKGLDKILKKLLEEAAEIVIAAKNPHPEEIKYEIADFLYHMMVLMADRGIGWEEIMEDLASR